MSYEELRKMIPEKMSNNNKLRLARILLWDVNDSWKESAVKAYDASMSFDELVCELSHIELSN